MPLPKTSDVGAVMKVLKRENKHKHRPRKQMVAIALSQARRYGHAK